MYVYDWRRDDWREVGGPAEIFSWVPALEQVELFPAESDSLEGLAVRTIPNEVDSRVSVSASEDEDEACVTPTKSDALTKWGLPF